MVTVIERIRPRFLVAAICFAVFALSRNIKYVTAKKIFDSMKSSSLIDQDSSFPSSLPGIRISTIRGGSLDEGSGDYADDGLEKQTKPDACSSEEVELDGGVVDLETAADQSGTNDSDAAAKENDISDESSQSLIEIATALRLEGKKYHDQGDFVKAAEVFQKAADTLLNCDGAKNIESNSMRMSEDYATCRLHQALCNLKAENYELCIEACTDVLQDSSDGVNSGSNYLPAINARAYHRRAKAKMALGDNSGALQDARTASFLGDGKAVNLYGRLMRETSSSDLSSLMNPSLSQGSSDSSSSVSPLSPHSALLESLMNKSNGGSPTGGFPDFSPASLLLGNGGGGNLLGSLGSGGGGMAKSVVKNLVKRLDDESTQVTICNFLQKTNKAQLTNLASMAGLDNTLEDSQLDKLVNFCHRVTPKGIRRTVRGTKAVVYIVKVIRRTIMVINKYKSLIVAAMIMQWMKSALFRPLPINARAAKKAAKLAAKEALKDAMKASRAGFF